MNAADLLILQKHIQLGKKHLESCLTQREIDTIFRFAKIPSETEEGLAANPIEVASQVSLVVNTILTSTVGFWMGLSGQLRLRASAHLISVLMFSIVVGALIGVQSILYRRKMTGDVLDKRKLKDLEIQLIKKICEWKEKELKELKIRHKPKKAKQHYDEETISLRKIAQKLAHFSMRTHVDFKSWVQGNFRRLFIELIPTLFGGAASLFVYIGGTRTFSQELASASWISFLERQDVRIAQLVILAIITIYFGFSYFYLNLENFKRDKEFVKIDGQLIREQKRLDLLNEQLLERD